MGTAAGLGEVSVLPAAGAGKGPDGHLAWQVLIGRRTA
jgi:hypothetical protein